MMPKGEFTDHVEILNNCEIIGKHTVFGSIDFRSKYSEICNLTVTGETHSSISLIIAENCHFKGPVNMSIKAALIAQNCIFENSIHLTGNDDWSARGSFKNCEFIGSNASIECYKESCVEIENCSFRQCAQSIFAVDSSTVSINAVKIVECQRAIRALASTVIFAREVSIKYSTKSPAIRIKENAEVVGKFSTRADSFKLSDNASLKLLPKSHIRKSKRYCISASGKCKVILEPGSELQTLSTVAIKMDMGVLNINQAKIKAPEGGKSISISNAKVAISGGHFTGNCQFTNCIGSVARATFCDILKVTGPCTPAFTDGNACGLIVKAEGLYAKGIAINGAFSADSIHDSIESNDFENCKFSCRGGNAIIINSGISMFKNCTVSYSDIGVKILGGRAVFTGETIFVNNGTSLNVVSGKLSVDGGSIDNSSVKIDGGHAKIKNLALSGCPSPAITVTDGIAKIISCIFEDVGPPVLKAFGGKVITKNLKANAIFEVNEGKLLTRD